MASVNKVIIIGNLGRDPELRRLPNGDAIANIAVATSFKSKDRTTGQPFETTEWHRIAFFGRLAELVGQYLRKGSSVYVEGRLHTRRYTDKDGIERYATDIIAEVMQMLGTPAAARQHAQEDADAHQGAVSQPDTQTYQAYEEQPAEAVQATPAPIPAKPKTPSKPAPKRTSKPAAAAPAN